jgi:4-hydroxy-tetrahydrodipicolinate reductase
MTAVAVCGAGGRMGRLVAGAVADTDDLGLHALYDPHHGGARVAGSEVSTDQGVVSGADVVVEFTTPDVVMGNLRTWREMGVNAVVGTSGFDESRLAALREQWGGGPPNCLVVPNFSIGAVLMMRFAEMASPHFSASEIIELHHDHKADAPSGTSIATAGRMEGPQDRDVESDEVLGGARGGKGSHGVPIHSVRLPGLIAHQEVLLGSPGETLSIRHDTTDRVSFLPGVLLAVRSVAGLVEPVTVGLEGLLGL